MCIGCGACIDACEQVMDKMQMCIRDSLWAARQFADASGWQPVQDPTNADPRYTRGALRALLAP